MYEMNYETAKMAFARKSRIDDPINGSFEVIGKVNLDNVVDLSKNFGENSDKFEAYYIEANCDDVLRKMYLVDMCKKATKKHCQITTDAPRKEWFDTNFDDVDKIVINRYSVDDKVNSQKLYEDTLTAQDYKKMNNKLKSKCAFRVDCERAGIEKVEQLEELIEFARKVGIGEIVFVAEKQLKHIASDKKEEFEPANFEELIKKIRNGEKLKLRDLEPMQIPNGSPLFFTMRDLLIMQGGHFAINKAISEKDKFFTKLTVCIGGLNVVFKQKITDHKMQLEMWRHSLSHKYIVEV